MILLEAERLALGAMALHGLVGWTFEFDEAMRYFGRCHWDKKKITLSRALVELNDEKHVYATILHEIAHALAPRRAGHGPEWKRIAVSIGDDGERCYSRDVKTPPARFVGFCPSCSRTVQRVTRKRGLACAHCCKGKYNRAYKFVWARVAS